MTADHLPPKLREELAEKYACYVLITCDNPSEGGQMTVRMSYEGDPSLAGFLIEGAHDIMENSP